MMMMMMLMMMMVMMMMMMMMVMMMMMMICLVSQFVQWLHVWSCIRGTHRKSETRPTATQGARLRSERSEGKATLHRCAS